MSRRSRRRGREHCRATQRGGAAVQGESPHRRQSQEEAAGGWCRSSGGKSDR
uniref:Uncharacterized protein n=1 Tax=Arundo donax TaxID=35708 RepID=A0A0A8YGK8_ARUDO